MKIVCINDECVGYERPTNLTCGKIYEAHMKTPSQVFIVNDVGIYMIYNLDRYFMRIEDWRDKQIDKILK